MPSEMTTGHKSQVDGGATIVIVTFNSALTILECLQSVENALRPNDQVVIVDNRSDDQTLDLIRGFILHNEQFFIIENHTNLGYAAAADQGAKAGCKPYVVFLNPDTLVPDRWIEHLQYHLIPEKVAAVGPVSNYTAGLQKARLYLPGKLRDPKDLDARNRMLREKYHRQAQETKLLIGFCLMIKRKVYERIGGMDEMLFLGNDDLDLSWRIRGAGYRLVVAKDCIVFHQGQVSFASVATKNTQRLVQESTDYLFYKLIRHYGPDRVPSSQQLWGIDWFRPGCRFSVNQPLTSIIVLTLNQVAYTKQCIESVFAHTKEPFELIVVDNGSTDGTLEYIDSLDRSKSSCLRIKVISNAENMGFAKGCNQGLNVAVGEFLLLLNNDVVVTSGWMSRLLHALEKYPEIDMVGPMTNYVSGPQLVENPKYDLVTTGGLERYAAVHGGQHDGKIKTNWRLAGFCMFMKRKVVEKIGGLDDRFIIGNFEDDDFCLRAYLAGFHAAIVNSCYVHHHGSQTFLGNKIDFDERLKSNWKVFKRKWNIPAETPYQATYNIPLPKKGFDRVAHYIPIDTGPWNTCPYPNIEHNRSEPHHRLPGRNPIHSANLQTIITQSQDSSRGVQMSNLNHIIDVVKNIVAAHDKGAAIWILQRVIEADPQNGAAHNELGLLFFEQNEIARAQSHLHQAVRFSPHNPDFFVHLGDFYHVIHKDSRQAVQMYVKAVEVKSDDRDTLLKIAHLFAGEQDFTNARDYYRRVLEIEPDHAVAKQCLDKIDQKLCVDVHIESIEAIYAQVLSQIDTGDRKAAMAGLKQILERAPDHALAHNDAGVLAYESNNKHEAFEHYQNAVALEPNNPVFLKNLGDFIWEEKGDPKGALTQYVKVLEIIPDDIEAILNCGRICLGVDKLEDARFFFEHALQIEPQNENIRSLVRQLDAKPNESVTAIGHDAHYREAKQKAESGDLPGAIEDLTKLVEDDRSNATAYNDLGVLYYEMGKYEKALGCYLEAVSLSPHDETFLKNLADFYFMQQGRIEDAMKLYTQLLEKNPRDVDSLLATGLICFQLNKTEDSREFFQRVIEIEPGNQNARLALDQIDKNPEDELGDYGKEIHGSPVQAKAIG